MSYKSGGVQCIHTNNVSKQFNFSLSTASYLESEYNALDRYYNEKSEQATKYHYQIGTLNSQLSSKRWELTQALEAAKLLVKKKK
jgi:hypothetical protein